MDRSELTIVEDQGLYANTCGYCKSADATSFAYGLWAHSLSPYDYQELLDQSWRRSGMVLYRPEPGRSCCPAYTIRLKADLLERSSENVRAMRRMQRYLEGSYTSPSSGRKESDSAQQANYNDVKPQNEECNMDIDDTEPAKHQTLPNELNESKQNLANRDSAAETLCIMIRHAIKECSLHGELPDNFEASNISVQRFQKRRPRGGRKLPHGEISYTCNVAFPCAAALLRQNSDCKILKSLYSQSKGANKIQEKITHQQVAAALADTIAFKLQYYDSMHNVRVQASKGHLNFIFTHSNAADKKIAFTKSQSIQGATDSRAKQSTKGTALHGTSQPVKMDSAVDHKMEIRTINSVFDPEEFALYRRYQIAIHNEKPEDVTEFSFRRFLVDTPLTFIPSSTELGNFWGFGSFHQQYVIDGRLVAVGVIDILPSCLSSNYFFWDPDFAFLSLGRYSALKEIEWVQEAKKYCQTLEYYYLGHYIHSCPKMHYKVTFRPSELLCPIKFRWVPFDLAHPLLDKQPFVCLSDVLQAEQKPNWVENSRSLIAGSAVGNVRVGSHCISNESPGCPEGKHGSEAAGDVNEGEMDNVLLKFEDNYMRFKQLQEWITPPDESLEDLISKLQSYIQLVGARLAARMAYILV